MSPSFKFFLNKVIRFHYNPNIKDTSTSLQSKFACGLGDSWKVRVPTCAEFVSRKQGRSCVKQYVGGKPPVSINWNIHTVSLILLSMFCVVIRNWCTGKCWNSYANVSTVSSLMKVWHQIGTENCWIWIIVILNRLFGVPLIIKHVINNKLVFIMSFFWGLQI